MKVVYWSKLRLEEQSKSTTKNRHRCNLSFIHPYYYFIYYGPCIKYEIVKLFFKGIFTVKYLFGKARFLFEFRNVYLLILLPRLPDISSILFCRRHLFKKWKKNFFIYFIFFCIAKKSFLLVFNIILFKTRSAVSLKVNLFILKIDQIFVVRRKGKLKSLFKILCYNNNLCKSTFLYFCDRYFLDT